VAWRLVRKAMFDNDERRRLYKEAREYLSLRHKRMQYIKDQKVHPDHGPVLGGSATRTAEDQVS
jgi:hypothetical protein